MRHNNPRRQQVELFLDKEENLSLQGNEPEENRVEGDGNNTIEEDLSRGLFFAGGLLSFGPSSLFNSIL